MSASALFGNLESQPMSDNMESGEDEDVSMAFDQNYEHLVVEASTRECLNRDIKKKIGKSASEVRKYHQAQIALDIPTPPVVGDITQRTMEGTPEDIRNETTEYLMKSNNKYAPANLEANETVAHFNDDGNHKLVPKGLAEIDVSVADALAVCPEADKAKFENALTVIQQVVAQRSTTSLEGEELVKEECDNADRMRMMLHTKRMIENIIRVSNTTHALKHFPKIIAAYTAGKDEAELAATYEEYVIAEEEVREWDEKIAKLSGTREGKARVKRTKAVKEIENLKPKIVAKVSNILRKKGMAIEVLKATLLDLMKEKEGEDFELGWFPTVKDCVNGSSRSTRGRSFTPTRHLGKHGRDNASSEGESPEKKLRTAKKFPLSSPDDVRHSLKEYFKNTDEGLTFTTGDDGFEQADGEWNADAQRKLRFLNQEVIA
jgi:hypothetical protein